MDCSYHLPKGALLHASALSSALIAVDAFQVEVEIDITGGVPGLKMVGLAEGAVARRSTGSRRRSRTERSNGRIGG